MWCSGYHVCLTRRRSAVQAGQHQGKLFTISCLYLTKKIMHFISRQFNIWYDITARNTNLKVLWCSGYQVCLTLRRSPVQTCTASRQVFDKMMFFYLIKNKIKHFISSQSNIWYEITARRANLKVMWCSGYQVCLTLRRSPVQTCTASRQVFDKMMFFYLIKNKIKHFISSQSNVWYEITARRTNLKVMWCSGYHVCLTRRRSPFQVGKHQGKLFTISCLYLTKKNHALYISSIQHLIWYYCFEVLNRRCCGVEVIMSAKHAEALQFKPGEHQGKFLTKRCSDLIKIKIKHFISSLSNIWY